MNLMQHIQRAAATGDPLVMGIVNVTPDSFSDGGQSFKPEQALKHARSMVEAGADMLDIGGESTRPGAQPVDVAQELDRVLPVIEALRDELATPISIDTMKPAVMRAAVDAGAKLINDVNGLRAPNAAATVAELNVPACIMHMQGQPDSMQQQPHYADVVVEVEAFFAKQIAHCVEAGIQPDQLILDPGFGFGKTLEHNLALLAALPKFAHTAPVLAGLSRKSMLGQITGQTQADQRVAASVAAALLAADRGAAIVRVHDVEATVDALKVRRALIRSEHRSE
ncbi:MAG: dihydropteroate synthase [Pseudomonadota bacterium]